MQLNQYDFSPAYQQPRGSATRELAKLAADPSVISFAGGYPATDAFDIAGLQQAARSAWEASPEFCVQYGPTEGDDALREALLTLTTRRGIPATGDQLLVTTGSQQALDFLLRSYIVPGDTVLVEDPTYPGALAALRLAGANVIGVIGDADGIDADAVEQTLLSLPSKPKLLYVVASFANPTGATLTKARRIKLLELAAKHQFLLVEDDPYGTLRFAGESVPPIRSLANEVPGSADWSIYLSTLSKTVAPGIRIGWLVGPTAITRRCVLAKQVSDMCSSPWTQAVANHYLRSDNYDAHFPSVVETYRVRAAAMADSLQRNFGESLTFAMPEGGMFLWAEFGGNLDLQKLFDNAIAEKVLFVQGSQCYFDNRSTTRLRLSYSTSTPPVIEEGVQRLRRAYFRSL